MLMCLQAHPQSIYYSLRTFVLSLRESAARALAEYSRSKQAAEAALKAALEAAAGDEQSECAVFQSWTACARATRRGGGPAQL
jgi:hypothetical protein